MTSQSRFEKAKAWLERSDPVAKQLSAVDVDHVAEERRQQTMEEFARASVLAEYQDSGLSPVYADPEHTMLVSLSMLLHHGWRIEQMPDGARRLVR